METFGKPRKMVEDERFSEKREQALKQLRISDIDPPISDIVKGFNEISWCFTLQSCHGHIIEQGPVENRVEKLEPESGLPESTLYQIAYAALVLENSGPGENSNSLLSCR